MHSEIDILARLGEIAARVTHERARAAVSDAVGMSERNLLKMREGLVDLLSCFLLLFE